MAIFAVAAFVATSPAGAAEPYPDPGFPVVSCPSPGQTVQVTSNAQLDPECTYTGRIEITASDVTLDCRGASVVNSEASNAGIRIASPSDEDMSGITVRNCVVSGFTNGIKVTRDGFRDLAAGDEYTHALEDVLLTNNTVTDTRGVGIYVDGYVTDTTITESTITGAGSSGIYLEAGSADNVVTHNQINDNGFRENGPGGQLESFGGNQFRFWGTGREGISIDGSRRNLISENTLAGNSAGGIYLYTNCGEYKDSSNHFERRFGATDNQITGNRLSDGVSGVWVGARMGENVLPLDCSDPPYVENSITQIILDRAANNTVSDNVFENMLYGVRVEDDETTVTGNSFAGPDAGHYAVIVGTPYRTTELHDPVAGTVLTGNQSTIAGNESPYRWVDGQTASTLTGNKALGQAVGWCESKPLPRGPFVMTIKVALEPVGAPVTPTPANLAIPPVGPQPACPKASPPPPGDDGPHTQPPPHNPSNDFKFGKLKLNKKRGTATLEVKVPGAGKLQLKGTGAVRGAKKTAKSAATIKLTVATKGKTAKTLRKRGKAKVKATVTFTPKGETSRSKSRTLRLVKKKA